jgi:hypothetical protein
MSQIDLNATNALKLVLRHATDIQYVTYSVDEISDFFVMWRNKKKISELVDESNIPEYEKQDKVKSIDFFKDAFINNSHTVTTLFAMTTNMNAPIVVTDGIHRAIGAYKAFNEEPKIISTLELKVLLLIGEDIASLDDYRLSI